MRCRRRLVENRVERVAQSSAAAPSLLAGLVYDGAGERMSPSHANKKGTRYRYYVSQSLIRYGTPASGVACRVPAADLEGIVEDQVCAVLRNDAAIFDAVGANSAPHREVEDLGRASRRPRHQVAGSAARGKTGDFACPRRAHRCSPRDRRYHDPARDADRHREPLIRISHRQIAQPASVAPLNCYRPCATQARRHGDEAPDRRQAAGAGNPIAA